MRILYLSQYFPPEAGATQARAYEIACHMLRLGHQVTVIAEIPNHPSGVIPPEYRGKLFERADLDGIDVIRVWVKTSPAKNFLNRMLFYLTYMVNAILFGLLLARGRYDLIYASSPPLFVGGAALALNRLRRTPLFFEVRDLWPDFAIALGELSHPLAISLASKLEWACYRRARAIIVVTESYAQRLTQRGVPSQKLVVIPNGANLDLFQYRPEGRLRLREQLSLADKFVAIYAGIHGIAQGLEIVIEAAHQLQDKPDIHILMVGEGPRKADLKILASRYRLDNLTWIPEQPRETIPDYLSTADVALVPLRGLEEFKGVLPSKMFDAWACERPVLLSVAGEARQLLHQAQGGLYIPPDNPSVLAGAILQLKDNPQERQRMGRSGRAFTEKNYSRQAQAEKLVQLIERLAPESKIG